MQTLKSIVEQDAETSKNQEKFEAIKKAHHEVYDTIVSLIETVDESTLLGKLDLLDNDSWMEVIEERFIAKFCGFPTCNNQLTPQKFQKYCIDRRSRKVYEVSTDRAKYCGSRCFEKSVSLRAQLHEQPLWITGPRKARTYKLDGPNTPIRDLKPLPAVKSKVEFVPDKLVARFDELKIADNHGDNASDDSDMDDAASIDSEELEEQRREDEAFVESIRNFVTSKNEETPKPQRPATQTDEEKLANLRAKYGGGKGKPIRSRIPPVIDAPIMPPTSSTQESSGQGLKSGASKSLFDTAWKTTREWLGDSAKELIDYGGPRLVNKIDIEEMKRFYGGEMASIEPEVGLPPVDSLQVQKRQCEIMINQLRKPWSQLEQRLEIGRVHYDNLLALIRSLKLSADNLRIFTPNESRVLALILFRLVCMLCNKEEEEKYFPADAAPSTTVKDYIATLKLDFTDYCNVIREVEKFLG